MRAYKVPQPVGSMLNESEIVCKTGGDFFFLDYFWNIVSKLIFAG